MRPISFWEFQEIESGCEFIAQCFDTDWIDKKFIAKFILFGWVSIILYELYLFFLFGNRSLHMGQKHYQIRVFTSVFGNIIREINNQMFLTTLVNIWSVLLFVVNYNRMSGCFAESAIQKRAEKCSWSLLPQLPQTYWLQYGGKCNQFGERVRSCRLQKDHGLWQIRPRIPLDQTPNDWGRVFERAGIFL